MLQADSPQANSTKNLSQLRVDDLVVNLETCTVRRGSELLELTDRSFRLFAALIRHAPEQVSKDQLIAEVWDDTIVSDDTLAQRVRLLRQSLGDDSQKPRYIAAVRGRGYRLVATARDFNAAAAKQSARSKWLAVAIASMFGLALAWWITTGPVPIETAPKVGTLAVLPFTDMSASEDYQYFADGMHEELLSRLALIDELAVISRTSVERYRGTDESLPVIAAQLGVNAIIEGSVRIDDDRLRVTVQLIDAASDEHIWAVNFNRRLSVQDIFELQTEVASQIADSLALEYASASDGGVQLPTKSIQAYNLYLLGRYHTFKQTRKDLDAAVGYLKDAIDIDPEFAEAFATLGWAYSFLGTGYGSRLPAEMYPKAKDAALRAIALDANLADARSLYADILTWYDWDFVAAEREYMKTIEIDPLNVLGYALFLSTQGRHDEAIAAVQQRLAADPDDSYVRINAGWRYLNAGQTEKAIEAAIATPQHADSMSLLGLSKLAQGDTVGAVDSFEAAVESKGRTAYNVSNLAVAYYRSGRHADAKPLLEELEAYAEDNFVRPELLAAVYFSAGDADRGFTMLNQAFDMRSREMIFLKVNQMLRAYRDDPRFLALVENVGLP